jgi:hypothetical protein
VALERDKNSARIEGPQISPKASIHESQLRQREKPALVAKHGAANDSAGRAWRVRTFAGLKIQLVLRRAERTEL